LGASTSAVGASTTSLAVSTTVLALENVSTRGEGWLPADKAVEGRCIRNEKQPEDRSPITTLSGTDDELPDLTNIVDNIFDFDILAGGRISGRINISPPGLDLELDIAAYMQYYFLHPNTNVSSNEFTQFCIENDYYPENVTYPLRNDVVMFMFKNSTFLQNVYTSNQFTPTTISIMNECYWEYVINPKDPASPIYQLRRLRLSADLISFEIRDLFYDKLLPSADAMYVYCKQKELPPTYFIDVNTTITDPDVDFICRQSQEVLKALNYQLITDYHRWMIKDLCQEYYNVQTNGQLQYRLELFYQTTSFEVEFQIFIYLLIDTKAPSIEEMVDYFGRNRLATNKFPIDNKFISFLFMNARGLRDTLLKNYVYCKHAAAIQFACDKRYNNGRPSLASRVHYFRANGIFDQPV
jgi:hypothetical protein